MANEWQVVKSTVDKIVRDAIASAGLGDIHVTEVEDVSNFESVLQNSDDAVIYQVPRLTPSPRAPKFELTFNVGAKTTDDGANFDLTRILGLLGDTFKQDAWFELRDYSTEEGALVKSGAMVLTDADVVPQQFDKRAGVRLIACRAKLMCRGG